MIYLKKSTRRIEAIYLHCTATKPRKYVSVETIRGWHVNGRGWSDIGYHYLIQPDGAVELGRDVDRGGDPDGDAEVGTVSCGMAGREFAQWHRQGGEQISGTRRPNAKKLSVSV